MYCITTPCSLCSHYFFRHPIEMLLLFQKSSLEQNLEESRAELLAVRTNHADTVSSLEAQVNQFITSRFSTWANVLPNNRWCHCSFSGEYKERSFFFFIPIFTNLAPVIPASLLTTGIQNELQHYWAADPSSAQRWLLQSLQKKNRRTSNQTNTALQH